MQDIVNRTESVTGAFIKELMRQAALRAALEDREPTAAHVSATLDERSALTRHHCQAQGAALVPG